MELALKMISNDRKLVAEVHMRQLGTHIDQKPKLLLRRLKTDKLEGLPKKVEHVYNLSP